MRTCTNGVAQSKLFCSIIPNVFDNRAMTRNKSNFIMQKVVLGVGGLTVKEHESAASKIFSLLFLFFVCAYPFLALIDVFRQDFETVAELIKYEFAIFVGVIKIIVVRLNRAKLDKLMNKLEPESTLENLGQKGDEERKLIKQGNFIATAQTTAYLGAGLVSFFSDITFSLSKRIGSSDYHDWKFTFGSFNIVNATYSPNFEILWAYQSFSTGCIAALFITIDATMGAILCYICFQLKILQSNLRCIVENSQKEMLKEKAGILSKTAVSNDIENLTIEWKYLHRSLKRAIEHHLAIINIIKDLNETFSTLLLMTFLGTMGMLTFMIYKVSMYPINDVRLIPSVVEIIVVTLQVMMVCFWSEQMMSEGKDVGTAAYEAKFIGTDLRFQKALTLIMRRSQTPLTLGAGKFVDISLSTFLWIIRSAYSTFMVLRKHNIKT